MESKVRRRFNKTRGDAPVGNRPIDRHFHKPTPRVSKLHRTYISLYPDSVAIALESVEAVGANGEKAGAARSAGKMIRQQRRTCIDCSNVLERR